MTFLEKLSKTLDMPEEKLYQKIDTFLIFAQVQLANLEDAIERKKYGKIVKYAHKIGVKASKLELEDIYIHTEHIELLATFKRDTDYMVLLEELRKAIYALYEEYKLTRELTTG